MNIFKSQIRIFKQGEESTLIFEMVVDHGEILEDEYRAFTLGNEVLLYSVGEDGKLSKVSIETLEQWSPWKAPHLFSVPPGTPYNWLKLTTLDLDIFWYLNSGNDKLPPALSPW